MKTRKECESCKTPIYLYPSEIISGKGRFCSYSCNAKVSLKDRDIVGANNPNWRGGIRKDLKYFTKTRQVYRRSFPHKYKAHRELTNAIRRGDLQKHPCCVCKSDKADGHHDDYSKPLDVMWLCRKHHMERHKWLRSKANEPGKAVQF